MMLCRLAMVIWKLGSCWTSRTILREEVTEISDAIKTRRDLWLATSAQRASTTSGMVSAIATSVSACYRQLEMVKRSGERGSDGARQ